MCVGRWAFKSRLSSPASSSRTCGTVVAGVCIFSPPGFLRQEPGRQEGERLMVMPSFPCPYLIVRQPRLTLGTLQAFLDPMLRLEHPRELAQRRAHRRVRQQVVMLPT